MPSTFCLVLPWDSAREDAASECFPCLTTFVCVVANTYTQNFFNEGPAWKDVMSQSGLDDMTLLSKLTNEQIMQNLKERFDNGIIYVRTHPPSHQQIPPLSLGSSGRLTHSTFCAQIDQHW